jgi:hopanoid C-3 methylase
VAASVSGHDVRILDLRLENTLAETMSEYGPDIVGTTGYTVDVPQAKSIMTRVRELNPQVRTVVGGHHASLVPSDFDSPDVDVVVIGEGESTFPEVVEAFEGKRDLKDIPSIVYRADGAQVATPARPFIANLDDTPMPARELVQQYRDQYYFRFSSSATTVETARGCPYRCTFCSVWRFYQKKCRMKSAERVVQEIISLPLENDYVCFVDDNFLQNLNRAERIGQMLKDAGVEKRYWMQGRSDSIAKRPDVMEHWAELGLSTILVGFESFRETDLAAINKSNSIAANEEAAKIMHANNIDIWGTFLINPEWDKSDFDALIDYVRHLKITFPQFTVLTPLPGTQLYEEVEKDLTSRDYTKYDFFHTVLPTKLPLEEFYANVARLYASTTMSLSELKHKIRTGNIPIQSMRRVRGMLEQLTDPKSYLSGGPC